MIETVERHIAAILESPAAPALAAQLNKALEEEKMRRLQFYKEIDDDEKAEFINGEVIIHSPVKKEHTEAVGFLYKIMDTYVRLSQLGFVGYEKVMTSLTRNDYEPDLVFFGIEKSDKFVKGQWKYPVPDYAVEVLSDSTESRDRGIKKNDYEAHGVEEYWIIDPVEETVEQYFLQNGQYKLHLKLDQGLIESIVIKGFAIELRAIFDEKANLEALRQLLTSEKK
jgi:Uma2 family endonuclease